MMSRISLTSGEQEALRWVAIGSMVIDHAAAVLLEPSVALPWRMAGRLAWPLFAFLVAYNVTVRNVDPVRYLRPLAIWGLVAQVPWMLAFERVGGNILFALLAGVLVLIVSRRYAWHVAVPVVLVLALVAEVANFEFGAVGVLLPWCLSVALALSPVAGVGLAAVAVAVQNWPWLGWPAALLALPVVFVATRWSVSLPRAPRWLVWGFYPGHLLILVGVTWITG